MTTPAQDAPFVLPSVAFRPIRLLTICCLVAVVAIAAAGMLGHVMFGVFFGVGLALGMLNAILVQRSVDAITSETNPLKRKMAVNSATRLLIISVIGLTIAFVFRPMGLGVLFGLALFQVLLILSTALPVWKKIRSGEPTATEEAVPSAEAVEAVVDHAPKD